MKLFPGLVSILFPVIINAQTANDPEAKKILDGVSTKFKTFKTVKATFTYKTFYRTRTEVSENWIRILNFYVDAFGEWTIGSEEGIKSGTTKNIPVEQ